MKLAKNKKIKDAILHRCCATLLLVAILLGHASTASALDSAGAVLPAGPNQAGSVQGNYDRVSQNLELASSHLKLTLANSKGNATRLTVIPAQSRLPWVEQASTVLVLHDGSSIDLATNGRLVGEPKFWPVDEAGLGPGLRAQEELRIERLGLTVRAELVLFDKGPYFTYRLIIPDEDDSIAEVIYLNGTLFPSVNGGEIIYITDNDSIRSGKIVPTRIDVPVGHGKPLLLKGENEPRGLLMALIDPSDANSSFQASAMRKGISFRWGKQLQTPGHQDGDVVAPRLFTRVVDAGDLDMAFRPYRSLMQTLYPPAPVPAWFRHQWISWYLYGTDIDEEKLKSQIDFIAGNLNDMGPWSILIDAGWYLAEGKLDGDWRSVDTDKFPSGLRALVDYAHERNVQVVLYFSASYLDDKEQSGNWLGLKGIIEKHPEWLVEIRSGDPWRAYYYNYSHPGFQQYLKEVLHDYFVEYGVDGIKVDGLEDSQMAIERGVQKGLYSSISRPIIPTTSLYAFIYQEAATLRPDLYLEAGWRMPVFSAPHFTIARQSDDWPDFGSGYPSPGLREHIDYAIAQRLLMGQRPHLGNFWGDPNNNALGLQWLEAGLALNAPVVLGFDLLAMTPQSLGAYRARLSMLRPFKGEVQASGLWPESFSSTVDGTTFLALFNRTDQQQVLTADLSSHGLRHGMRFWGYDIAADRPLSITNRVISGVEPQSLRLFVLRSEPGVLWTGSSFQVTNSPNRLELEMGGPDSLPGYAYIAIPSPISVTIDGQPATEDSWSYDPDTAVLIIQYPHKNGEATRIEIQY